ncbi:MAG: hypothetical protein G8345_03315 [Magnetococcales bacterium]|nr:hypothetical protein [Magnetococcales bacterium]NGZ25903.1 hypothetical protein [Magnetococcales bacterium]
MRNIPVWLSLAAALLVSGCATDTATTPPPAPMATTMTALPATETGVPEYKVGDRWEYSDGYGLEVTKVEAGGWTTMNHLDKSTVLSNDWIQRRGIFTENRKTGNEMRQVVFRSRFPEQDLFPLAIGKQSRYKREYLVNGKDLREHQTSWKVVGRDTIEVPAGKFEVWILDYETQSITTDWYGRERWYYSPQVKNYVRMEYQYGKAPPSSRVLMSHKVAP